MGIRSLVNSKTMKGRLWDTDSPTVLPGMCVAEDVSISTSERGSRVTKPSPTSLEHSAYMVSAIAGSVGHKGELSMLPLDQYLPNVSVYTDASVTAGDVLGPVAGSYNWRRGSLFMRGGFVASQTVDRSTTAGTVTGTWFPVLPERLRQRAHYELVEDWTQPIEQNDKQATAVAFELRGWDYIAASGTVAVGNTGRCTLTPQATTDNASAVLFRNAAAACISPFKIAVGSPLLFDVHCIPTDTGGLHDFFLGMIDNSGAGGGVTVSATVPLQNDSAGPPADYDGFGFMKLGAGTTWEFESGESTGATESTDASAGTFTSGSGHRLQILWDGKTSLLAYVNGVLGATNTVVPIAAAVIAPVFQCKGQGTSTPNLVLGSLSIVQARPTIGL